MPYGIYCMYVSCKTTVSNILCLIESWFSGLIVHVVVFYKYVHVYMYMYICIYMYMYVYVWFCFRWGKRLPPQVLWPSWPDTRMR